jgi:hypothetical protein
MAFMRPSTSITQVRPSHWHLRQNVITLKVIKYENVEICLTNGLVKNPKGQLK